MDYISELQQYNVSRETISDLEKYVELLTEWNNKMNLVSRKSLPEVWTRHVLDSGQLIGFLPQTVANIVDLGSGAGFPGLVLAILLKQKSPQTKLILIESISKKTMFLNTVCQRLQLKNVIVKNERIENCVFKNVDVITARALASLSLLCKYAHCVADEKTKMLFLKGKNYVQEIAESEKYWQYELSTYQNKYCSDGVILELSNLRKRK